MSIWSFFHNLFSSKDVDTKDEEGLIERDGLPLIWKADSVEVKISSQLPFRYLGTCSEGIRRINAVIGREFLVINTDQLCNNNLPYIAFSDPAMYGYIYIRMKIADIDGSGDLNTATTEHQYNKQTGQILSAVISLPDCPKRSNGYGREDKIMLHELCHAIGLDHDANKNSIMYPKVLMTTQFITDRDQARLKQIYG